jgi:hypothetical protein
MLAEGDLQKIRRGLEGTSAPIELIFHPAEHDSPFASKLLESAQRIEAATDGKVPLRRDDHADLVARPALTLSSGDRSNLHYLAIPEGLEAPPFVDTLVDMARGRPESPGAWADDLRRLAEPAQLLVFVAPTCPHCPQAARHAGQIAVASARVSTSIIDVQQYTDLAQRFRAQSVPLTVLDQGLCFTGVVPASDLVRSLSSRGTAEHEASVFDSLVEHGRLDEAAARIRSGTGAVPFVSAWRGSSTGSRMRLMLVASEVLDADPRALDRTAPELVEVLGSDDVALRGDTADLLGQIGHPSAADGLRVLLEDPHPDVVEVAEEALEAIESQEERPA